MLGSGHENIIQENITESKVGSRSAGDHNAKPRLDVAFLSDPTLWANTIL